MPSSNSPAWCSALSMASILPFSIQGALALAKQGVRTSSASLLTWTPSYGERSRIKAGTVLLTPKLLDPTTQSMSPSISLVIGSAFAEFRDPPSVGCGFFGTGVPKTRYCPVPSSWYRHRHRHRRRSRADCSDSAVLICCRPGLLGPGPCAW